MYLKQTMDKKDEGVYLEQHNYAVIYQLSISFLKSSEWFAFSNILIKNIIQ